MIGVPKGRLAGRASGLSCWVAASLLLAACGGGGGAAASAPTAPAAGGAAATPTAAGFSPAAAAATPTAGARSASGGTITLTGAGSTFDNPLFSKTFDVYTKAHPSVHVNYQSVGSGAGIQQLTQNTVDFGASDAPLTNAQMTAAGNDVVHIPVTLGAVAVSYNLPGVKEGLKMTGPVLADIYLGTITKWNDPQLAKLNPGVTLPATDIAVVHRSDGSGTTDIYTHYLASVSPNWKTKVGAGLSVNWPVGIGGKGSEGVAGQVKQVPGGLGYFELAYAKQNNLTSVAIVAPDGQALLPSSDGASACAASVADKLPADLRVRIAGCSGKGAYPISGFSWVVIRSKMQNEAKAQALVNLLAWLTSKGGQQYAGSLYYAELPTQVQSIDATKLKNISVNGKLIVPTTG